MSRNVSIEARWESPRWDGINRAYQVKEVARLRGTARVEHPLARTAADKLWRLLHQGKFVPAQSAITGDQAVEIAKAGLKAVYLDTRLSAANAKIGGQMNPDQSLFPGSVPKIVRSINNALIRAEQAIHADGQDSIDWMLPIVADAEAGFGASLNAFELTKSLIEAGAAAVQFGDHFSYSGKRGHVGGKVLLPTREVIHDLIAARLAADILDVPTILIARTDANDAHLFTRDGDPDDSPFLTCERTAEGFFAMRGGIEAAIVRGRAYAPFADMVWFETSEPNLAEARKFANAIHAEFPGKLLAYSCPGSPRSKPGLNEWEISQYQHEFAAMGYRFQFAIPAGYRSLNVPAFEAAHGYAHSGTPLYL